MSERPLPSARVMVPVAVRAAASGLDPAASADSRTWSLPEGSPSSVVSVGGGLSVIVAVPVAPAAFVTLPVIAPVDSVKVSEASAMASSVVARRNCSEVWPAAMVTAPDTGVQLVPPSVETSSAEAAAVSVPTVAVPLPSVGVKLVAPLEALSSETVNTAVAPSATETLLTLIVGVSLSVMVAVAITAVVALDGHARSPVLIRNVSLGSASASSTVASRSCNEV